MEAPPSLSAFSIVFLKSNFSVMALATFRVLGLDRYKAECTNAVFGTSSSLQYFAIMTRPRRQSHMN